MYLNATVPRLQIVEGALRFIRQQRQAKVASTNAVEPLTRSFVKAIEEFVEQHQIPMVSFQKGSARTNWPRRCVRSFPAGTELSSWARRRRSARCIAPKSATIPRPAAPTPGSSSPLHWSITTNFYCVDENFGPFFLKFCSYFTYNAKLCLNGHEYAKQQLQREGIAYQTLDNGIRASPDPKRLQHICDCLSAAKIDALLRKWLRCLPHPYPAADRAAGLSLSTFHLAN